MKELKEYSIRLHTSRGLLRFSPQAAPPLLLCYTVERDCRVRAEQSLCDKPFKALVVSWLIDGGFTRLI
jgi:hypothetical protein